MELIIKIIGQVYGSCSGFCSSGVYNTRAVRVNPRLQLGSLYCLIQEKLKSGSITITTHLHMQQSLMITDSFNPPGAFRVPYRNGIWCNTFPTVVFGGNVMGKSHKSHMVTGKCSHNPLFPSYSFLKLSKCRLFFNAFMHYVALCPTTSGGE